MIWERSGNEILGENSMEHLYMENGMVNPRLLEKKFVIYGCGHDGKKLFEKAKEQGREAEFFCDSDPDKWGGGVYERKILSPEELKSLDNYNIALAFFRWPEVIGNISGIFGKTAVFADFLFEKESDERCILCNRKDCTIDKAHFSPFLVERMFIGEDKKTALVHCKHCNFYFSKYRPNNQEMERLYTSYRGEEYQNQRQKYEPEYTAEHVEKKYYNREFHKIRREALAEYVKPYVDFSKVTTVLDYGGDEGQMIPHQFKNAGKYVYDISGNQTVEGVSMINDLDVVKRTSWDFLMCCQLLEHVSNPHEVISTLASCLSDGGYLYLEVPAKAPFRQYSDVEVSEHISFYTKETMYEIGNIFPLQVKSVEIFSLQGKVALRALFQKKSQ